MLKTTGLNNYVVGYADLHTFKRRWPCHNIPDDVGAIEVTLASNGDLIDLTYLTDEDDGDSVMILDDVQASDSGARAAVSALVDDVKAYSLDGTLAPWMI